MFAELSLLPALASEGRIVNSSQIMTLVDLNICHSTIRRNMVDSPDPSFIPIWRGIVCFVHFSVFLVQFSVGVCRRVLAVSLCIAWTCTGAPPTSCDTFVDFSEFP